MPLTDEQKKQQQQAKAELDEIVSEARPKNLRQGLSRGVGNILGGCVGGVGVVVLAPVAGLAIGTKQAGLLGGIFGLVGGALVGVVGGAAVIVGGALNGIGQFARGIIAIPEGVTAPSQGKWWNDRRHLWIYTDLPKDLESIKDAPEDDEDILGELEKDVASSVMPGATGDVKDTYYYDVLEVDPKADPSAIKRKYYVLARKYHPDKNPGDKEAADKFKDIGEAYQVLSDVELRARYDKDGRDGLSADKTTVADDAPKLDPALLFAFLFGSDRFEDYTGRVAMATSAMVGDSPKVGRAQASTIQTRRVTRLAGKLAGKLQKWTEGDEDASKALWKTEAADLATASYGLELVHTIGTIYTLAAVHFIGSTENGVGLPAVSDWAKSLGAKMKKDRESNKNKYSQMKSALDAMIKTQQYEKKLAEAKTDEEKAAVQKEMEANMASTLLQIMWTTTVVDLTSTLWEVAQMMFFDQSVDKEIRKKRAHGLKSLGEVFMETPAPKKKPGEEKDAQKLYEEAAFAAMLETVQRQDQAKFAKEHAFK
jgi:hypothetical protein